jgi:hypothetical protein
MIREIENLKRYYNTKVQGQGSRTSQNYVVRFGLISLTVRFHHLQ